MAERRMFTKKVTDDDKFMQLSSSAQALYLHLAMSADDDGFSNQVTISMFRAHASTQDLQALLENRYIYQFENGVIVIRHWRMANALRKDRYNETTFRQEMQKLDISPEGVYNWQPTGNQLATSGCQMVTTGKERLGEVREGKERLGEESEGEESPERRAAQSASTPAKEPRHKYGEYKNVLLTDKDMEKLKTEFPNDWQDRIERLSAYIASTGKSYKNHLATIRNWARMDQERGRTTTTTNGVIQVTNKHAEELDAFYNRMTAWAESED